MTSYNNATLVGRLVADPEIRYTTDGKAVTKFRIAVNKKYKKDEAIFLPVVTWGKLAEISGEYLRKGQLVLVDGELDIRQYESDGINKQATELNANTMQMLGKKDVPEG